MFRKMVCLTTAIHSMRSGHATISTANFQSVSMSSATSATLWPFRSFDVPAQGFIAHYTFE